MAAVNIKPVHQTAPVPLSYISLVYALVVSVLLYVAKTWTLIKSDEQKLEVFLRRILGIRSYDFVVKIASVMNQTQQRGICSRIRDVLQESVPAHEALHLAVNTRAGQRPDDRPDWKRPQGRPRHTWNDPPAGGRRRAHCRCRLKHGQ